MGNPWGTSRADDAARSAGAKVFLAGQMPGMCAKTNRHDLQLIARPNPAPRDSIFRSLSLSAAQVKEIRFPRIPTAAVLTRCAGDRPRPAPWHPWFLRPLPSALIRAVPVSRRSATHTDAL